MLRQQANILESLAQGRVVLGDGIAAGAAAVVPDPLGVGPVIGVDLDAGLIGRGLDHARGFGPEPGRAPPTSA